MKRQYLFTALLMLAGAAQAGSWPARPITLVVPYPAGGNADAVGRFVANGLGKQIGKEVIVENRGGAGATIGARAVATAAPDGYTLLLAPTAVMAITPHLRAVPYKIEDFEAVANVSGSYGIVAARKDLPANNMDELVALARSQPGKLTYGSAGQATATHLSGVMVSRASDMELLHIPYKGSIDALNDLVGGQIDLIFDPVALTQVQSGRVKAFASTGQERNPELPDVPTLKELGYEVDTRSWFGVFVPQGTPADITQKLADGVKAAVEAPDTRDILLKFSQYPRYQGPAEFAQQVRDDSAYFKQLIADANITVE